MFLRHCYKLSTSPHQILELRMCELSHRIRERHNWWKMVNDGAVVEKWREQTLRYENALSTSNSSKLTPAMVRFCDP